AHTNADVAAPGVSGALAARLGLSSVRPLVPAVDDASRGTGRIGVLPSPVALAELAALAARVLPATAWGVRVAGDPERRIGTAAVPCRSTPSWGGWPARSPYSTTPGSRRRSPSTTSTATSPGWRRTPSRYVPGRHATRRGWTRAPARPRSWRRCSTSWARWPG